MKEIKAREGYYLTQVGNVGEARVYITAIKGANINEDDWREATDEEKKEYDNAMNLMQQSEISSIDELQ